MNCQKTKDDFADYLTGDLDDDRRTDLQSHIAGCASCREELENLTAVWAKLGVLPEEQPSASLRQRFYAMLEEAKVDAESTGKTQDTGETIRGWKDWIMFRRPSFAAAFSIFLLLLGLGSGWLMSGGRLTGARMAALEEEIREIRQTAALSLLGQPSASERLQGISYSAEIDNPDSRTLAALIETLNTDSNPNVRLASVEALYLFRNQPGVKEGLVRSLAVQSSPLVQVALIDLLVEIRERRAAEALKVLIETEYLNPDVKKRAEEGLEQIL